MQEVETAYFTVLEEDLGQSGFKGIQKPHYEGQNGLATFYNTQRFKMQKSVSYNFNELLSKLFDLGQFEKENKYNERVVLFSHLVDIKTGKSIVIGECDIFIFRSPPDEDTSLQCVVEMNRDRNLTVSFLIAFSEPSFHVQQLAVSRHASVADYVIFTKT